MTEFLDYETLRIIWWALMGLLLTGFAITDGFDLGIGILLPFVAKNNEERRLTIKSILPVWEGNQVWLILGAGAIFAAWPYIYAVSFSGLYFAMLAVLLALILRPVGFDYRDKINNQEWRNLWDSCLFIAGFVPSLVFGVAIGNVIQGLSFSFNEFMVMENHIEFFDLFTPFPLLCGILSVTLFITHGACYLAVKTEFNIQRRAINFLKILPFLNIILFALGGVMLKNINGYEIVTFAGSLAESSPLQKIVITKVGSWFANYEKYKWIIIAPVLGFLGQILVLFFVKIKHFGKAFIANALAISSIIATVGLTLFPFILPSKLNPSASLLVWDSSSSYFTLFVMLIAIIFFMPIILIYTSWVYKVLRGKVK